MIDKTLKEVSYETWHSMMNNRGVLPEPNFTEVIVVVPRTHPHPRLLYSNDEQLTYDDREQPMNGMPAVSPTTFSDHNLPALISRCIPSVVAIARADNKGWGASGIVISETGTVLTVRHGVNLRSKYQQVMTHDGVIHTAVVDQAPHDQDLVTLKLLSPNYKFTPTTLSQEPLIVLGKRVLCIGHPYGYTYTCTTGVISGLNRTVTMPTGEVITDCIQTDAAINPGNSGGPLFDGNGEVVGIVFATRDAANDLAFAMTVVYVQRYVNVMKLQVK